jgi:hypothetical protein
MLAAAAQTNTDSMRGFLIDEPDDDDGLDGGLAPHPPADAQPDLRSRHNTNKERIPVGATIPVCPAAACPSPPTAEDSSVRRSSAAKKTLSGTSAAVA